MHLERSGKLNIVTIFSNFLFLSKFRKLLKNSENAQFSRSFHMHYPGAKLVIKISICPPKSIQKHVTFECVNRQKCPKTANFGNFLNQNVSKLPRNFDFSDSKFLPSDQEYQKVYHTSISCNLDK